MNWKNVIEYAGMAALIVGLFLVYEELSQAGTIARAELSAESARLLEALNVQERDPGFASILVKSQRNPEELTVEERIQLNAYLESAVATFGREKFYYDLGIFESWKEFPQILGPRFFGTRYGRAYWDIRKSLFFPAEIAAEVDNALMNTKAVQYYRDFDSNIVDGLQ
jgi:hypothetical protein